MAKMFTIFTPTYNRAHALGKLYDSLVNQPYKNFEWLVVDDGSTDGTQKLIEGFKEQNKICINYIGYPENGGLGKAFNIGLENAVGEYFAYVGSDDCLRDEALQTAATDLDKLSGENRNGEICGVGYLYSHENGEIIGAKAPKDGFVSSFYDLTYRHGCPGDKLVFTKTDIARNYTIPVVPNEKHVSSGFYEWGVAKNYVHVFYNKILAITEYSDDGITKNKNKLFLENPVLTRMYIEFKYDFYTKEELIKECRTFLNIETNYKLLLQLTKRTDNNQSLKKPFEGGVHLFGIKGELFPYTKKYLLQAGVDYKGSIVRNAGEIDKELEKNTLTLDELGGLSQNDTIIIIPAHAFLQIYEELKDKTSAKIISLEHFFVWY